MTAPEHHKSAAELLADWRAAGRDTAAAHAAASVAELALKAAAAAEEAAVEVEAAAQAARDAVERAMGAAARAKRAASEAAESASVYLAGAEADKVRANHVSEVAEEAEAAARDRFHEAQAEDFPKD